VSTRLTPGSQETAVNRPSPLQEKTLAILRERQGIALYSELLTLLFGLEPSPSIRYFGGLPYFDRQKLGKARVNSACASLSRSLARLERAGVVERLLVKQQWGKGKNQWDWALAVRLVDRP
jgi:hypothetical protein